MVFPLGMPLVGLSKGLFCQGMEGSRLGGRTGQEEGQTDLSSGVPQVRHCSKVV